MLQSQADRINIDCLDLAVVALPFERSLLLASDPHVLGVHVWRRVVHVPPRLDFEVVGPLQTQIRTETQLRQKAEEELGALLLTPPHLMI